jgi:protocatechuate 3,4-dioxygenase beta subunit
VGVVRDDRGQPAVGVEAVLVPERARDHAELYRTATTDRSGRFEITSVVPGDYRIYAWAAMEPYAYFAPEAQRRFARQATSVRVSERSRNNVEVTLIPEALSQ